MERSPRVSVLTTCFNRESLLGASIESVLAQTFADFELIVVDDASSDGSAEVARRYAALDSRVRVVVNERNLGDYPNRNRAIALAGAPFVKFHDSDDILYPHCLEVLDAALRGEERAALALTAPRAWPGGPCPMLLSPRLCYEREFLGPGMFGIGASCAYFRLAALRALGGFPERGVYSDYLFWLRVFAVHHVLLVPADLFWYRIHAAQEYRLSTNAELYVETFRATLDALRSPDCPLDGAARRQALANFRYVIARDVLRNLRSRQWRLAGLVLRDGGLQPADWLRAWRRQRRQRLAGTPLTAGGDYVMPQPGAAGATSAAGPAGTDGAARAAGAGGAAHG